MKIKPDGTSGRTLCENGDYLEEICRYSGLLNRLAGADTQNLLASIDSMHYYLSLVGGYDRPKKLAQNLLSWRHSGFSIDNQVRIPAFGHKARQVLSQYIAKHPVSLKKVIFEQYDGKVIYYSEYNDYFKRNMLVVHDFIASLTQHIPGRDLR